DRDYVYTLFPLHFGRNNLCNSLAQPHVLLSLTMQMGYDAAVTFGPGQEWLRLRARLAQTRREVEQPGPGAGLFQRRAVVVAAGVAHQPAQPRRGPAVLIEPVGPRERVEPCPLGVVGAGRHRNGERTPAAAVAPRYPAGNLGTERLELTHILLTLADVQVQSLVPATPKVDAFLRVAAEVLLGHDGIALLVAPFEDA